MKLGEIIRQYRAEHSLSQRQFAKRSGLSHSYIPLLEKGQNPSGDPLTPSIPVLKQLADAMDLSLRDLMAMTDDDLKAGFADGNAGPTETIPGIFPIRKKSFPLFGEIACGEPRWSEEEHETMVEGTDGIDADFCLRAKGSSMTGAGIDDGDIVFIKQMPMVDNGDIAAVVIENETTLKRVDYDQDAAQLILWPENPAYRPLIYRGEQLNAIRILGRAVMAQKILGRR